MPAVERTKDGWVGFMIVTAQQWHDFCVLVERPDWTEDKSLLIMENRGSRRSELQPAITSWMAAHTTREVVECASLLRLPVAEIGNGAMVTGFDHFVLRNFYVRNPRGGFSQPEVPYRLANGAGHREYEPAPRLGEHNAHYRQHSRVPSSKRPASDDPAPLPFEGLRVADFTAFWAGPIVGHFLAMLGADVIHVESAQRPDGMRMNTVKTVKDAQWWEWAPLFHGPNTNKRDLTLDLQKERGRELARQLISKCDLLLENYSPRVLEHWGLGYEEVHQLRPDIVMVRMPAFGLSGPWRDRTGYAQTMEQVSGMAWITGCRDQAPQIPNGPCDPIAGTHATAALLLALEYRRRTGKGMLVEVPMVGGALNIAAEQVVEFSAYGNLLERDGNRGPAAAPQNLYLSADVDERGRQDRWIALAIETDAQWAALRRVLGDPWWASAPEFATLEGRRAAVDDIDREIAAWCRQRSSNQILDRLWPAGVPVASVIMPHELAENPQLGARGFFEHVQHPVTGINLHGGYPIRFSAGPQRLHRRHAPTLGQDNEAILGEVLGLSADEIRQLAQDGIIGNTPKAGLSGW
jgi:crotonobetainyl-CoA:carnitine CoA-transferase CaiB-like acyl-CoA transferase